VATTIDLSMELGSRLDELASKTGQSREYYVRQFIEEGIAETEAYYRGAAVMERVSSGHERVFSSAEVRARLGLDD
jgi:RHH-type rel operon transcriptional repressor/antitoxin RelB